MVMLSNYLLNSYLMPKDFIYLIRVGNSQWRGAYVAGQSADGD